MSLSPPPSAYRPSLPAPPPRWLALLLLTPVLAVGLGLDGAAAAPDATWTLRVHTERQILDEKSADVVLELVDSRAVGWSGTARLDIEGDWIDVETGQSLDQVALIFEEGRAELGELLVVEGQGHFTLEIAGQPAVSGRLRSVHSLWTLLPPLLAIALALWLRQVYLALTAGVLAGAWILHGSPVLGFTQALQDLVVGALTDSFQGAILLFTATLGGMVGVMAKAGGTHGLVEWARRWMRSARSAQAATVGLGVIIFFDDYANTLLVGNTMRPVTDRMRVSREKLSYLVDSTAAPIATVAVLSTWVGYQVGLIGDGLVSIGRADVSAYSVFVSSIPYAAYSWFALALVAWLVGQQKDFGTMLAAERRARATGEVLGPEARPLADDVGSDLEPVAGAPRRAHLALLPVVTVLLGTVAGLYFDGRRSLLASGGPVGLAEANLRDVFSAADPAAALLWAVVLGSSLVVALAVGERILDLQSAMDAFVSGVKAMVPALMILILAWSIGDVCEKLGTATVVVDVATGNLSATLVPTVTFLVAAFLGFSTGTSWGTMAILMPIVIPLADRLPAAAGVDEATATSIFLASVASVLSGSVFGDHCSPISDTTIMSSMASGSDHVDHVRTQLPYAGTAGALAVLLGTLPAGLGWSPWLTLPLGVLILGGLVRLLGRRAESGDPKEES